MRASIGFAAATAIIALSPLAPIALAADDSTGPALGVARISIVQGDVATMRGDSGDWIAATQNLPIVEGDAVHTRGDSRAEIQLAYGNFVRLGGYAEVVFLELGRKKFRFRVLQGTVVYSELAKSEADVDIETPLAAARPMKPGRYQVKVGPEATYISVRKGKTEVAFRDQSRSLEAGRMMVVRAAPSGTEYEIRRADPASVLEEWAAARDKEASRATSYRFVSQDIYGAGELDYYGEWRYVPGMGHSWFPYVTASWVPYRHGRWVWLDYYGWSWVGAEPWGWSPYHWGRWYRHSIYGWGWYPGAPTLSHVWRPALVTFFGYGSQLAINSIGWCPLGPGERYDPWYGRRLYNGSARNVIIADNSVRIYNTYRNARAAVGVSHLAASNFGRGASQTPRALRLAGTAAPFAIRGPLPVVPDRASQGDVLQSRSTALGRAGLTAMRRGGSTVLRDGTSRVSFDAQRSRVRASVEEFQRAYQAGTAPRSGSSTRQQPRAASTGSLSARNPATSTAARGSAPRAGASVRTRSAQSRVASPVYAPRTQSRIRTSVSQGSIRQGSVARGNSRTAEPQARTLPRSARQRQASRATIGSTATVRSPGSGQSSRTTVFTPRTSSRIGGSAGSSSRSTRAASSASAPRTASRTSRSSPVYVPRTSSRTAGASRSAGGFGSSRGGGGPAYSPRSSSGSSSSYGGYRSSSPSYSGSTRGSSSSSSSRSASPSYGGSRSSSSGSFGSSRSSSSSSGSSRGSSSSSGSSRSSSSSSSSRDR